MSEVTEEQKMHHYMGIEMNIQTWNLLDNKERNEQDDFRMINFAKASLYHWRKSDKYELVNEQRGQWMLSRVYSCLGKAEEALSYAKETLKITEEQELQDFDLGYAYESMARAYAAFDNKDESIKWLEKAKKAGDLIKDDKDNEYFISDLESEPWFNIK